MGTKIHRNPVQIATATNQYLDVALSQLKDREILYNRDTEELGIVFNHQFNSLSGAVDEVNVTRNSDKKISLKDDIAVSSVTAFADHNGINWKSQYKIAETTTNRTIILLCKQDLNSESNIGLLGGDIIEKGNNVSSHYQFSLSTIGSRFLKGASTNKKKSKLCLTKYNNSYYYGINFKNSKPANIYFSGWVKIPEGVAAPEYTTYTDGDLSETTDLDSDSDAGTQVVEIPNVGGNSDSVSDLITSLPNTGEDGSPHTIRLDGQITREMLLKIAVTLKVDSNKQVIIDCSKGTMEPGRTDWRIDGVTPITYKGTTYLMSLNSCFSNCIGLREFYYPKNVISSGSNTFNGCSFLRKVAFNKEMESIGDTQYQWAIENNSLFAGARIKTLFFPKSIKVFGGYCFANSNIRNIYIEESSEFVIQPTVTYGGWCSFIKTKKQIKFFIHQDLYNKWNTLGTINSAGNGSMGCIGDGIQYLGPSDLWSDHITLWEGTEETIDYTE